MSNCHLSVSNALHRVGRIGRLAGFGAAVALCLPLLGGCAAMGPPANSIDVVHDHQPDDIPIPQHFTYDDRELASFAYIKFQEAPRLAMRSMKLTYWGDRPVQEIQRWYLDQMPKQGWRHVATDGFVETHMRFAKGPERAEIYLKRTPDEAGRYYVTRLVVEIGVN